MAGGTGQGGDAFRRPASSELPEIPIPAYLAMLQATELALSSRNGIQRQGAFREQTTGIINIVNSTGADLELYSIVGLDAPMNLPDSEAGGGDPFQVEPIYFRAIAPDVLFHCGRFAIVIEPIEADGCGRACVAGICRVKITVPDEDTERHCAEIIDFDSAKLAAVHRGSAEILWREGGTGEQWAIVRLGPRQPAVTFAVELEQVGGTQGDDTTAASWTYDVYDAASWELLASAVDPTALRHGWQRPSVGQMIAATNGTAHWDIDDELVLDWINEMVDAEACE